MLLYKLFTYYGLQSVASVAIPTVETQNTQHNNSRGPLMKTAENELRNINWSKLTFPTSTTNDVDAQVVIH